MNKLCMQVFAALAAAVTVLSIFSVSTAQAAPKDKDVRSDLQNCTLEVETRATQCFRTLTEAIFHVTQGRVADAPADARKLAADKNMTAKLNAPATSLVLGVFYYWENYGAGYSSNPVLVISSNTGVPCTGATSNVDYSVSPLADFSSSGGHNWNNNIRSAKVFNVEHPTGVINYNNCFANLFDLPNFGGTSTGYLPNSADLGSMRDRAESIRFS